MGVPIAALLQFKAAFAKKLQQHGNIIFLISLPVLAAAYFLCTDQQSFSASMFGFPLVAIGYGMLVFGAVCTSSSLYKNSSIITSKIASLSYVIYLTHKIIIHLTQQQFYRLHIEINSNSMFLICVATCFAGALLVNKIIEKPFRQVRDKLLKFKKPLIHLPQ